MGSLVSRPKAPKVKTIVVQSPLTPVQPVTPTPLTSTPVTATPQPDPEGQASETRTRDLLTRRRGVLGTINTGFRGLLGTINTANRKTLLGE